MAMAAATDSWVVDVVIITLPEGNTHCSSHQTMKEEHKTTAVVVQVDTWGMRRGLTVRAPKATSGVQNIIPCVRRKCRLQ